MTPTPEVQQKLRRYLLGQLGDEARGEVEKELFTHDEIYQELLVVEDEMVDEYLADKLGQDDRRAFETNFLGAPERRRKLRFGRALNRYVTAQPGVRSTKQPSEPWRSARPQRFRGLFSSRLAIAAFAILAIAVALGIWRAFLHRQSQVDQGLIALNSAYRQQRPLQSRVSSLSYAPFPETRGEPVRVDLLALRRAEAILSDPALDNNNAAAHHAIGQVYLSKKQFDLAIKEFDEALKTNPNNAQIYSDLGAAWLEQGKIDVEKGTADPAAALGGKGMEELGRALENLNKALEYNPNLPEALFNRALCEEQLTLLSQAENDWEEYLKRDSNSPWADEARAGLKRLQGRKNNSSRSKEQLLQDFIAAYESRTDEVAWRAFSISRGRAGNFIIESLIDDYLSLSDESRTKEAEQKLRMVAYAADLERQRVKDRYTSDLVKFYQRATPSDRKKLAEARNLMRSANQQYNISEFDDALEIYSNANKLFTSVGDDPEAMFAESWIGYCRLRNLDAGAIPYFERLVNKFGQLNYLSLDAQSRQALADAESSGGEISKPLESTNRALQEAEDIEDSVAVVRCLTRLLVTHLELDDHEKSLGMFLRSTNVAEKVPRDPTLTWPNYYEAGLNFHFLGLDKAAFAFEHEAMALANEAAVPLLRSRSFERLGILYAEKKEFEQAIQNGELAIAEAQKIKSDIARTNAMAHSLLRLGGLNSAAGKYNAAVDNFDKSLVLYQQLKSNLYLYEASKGKLNAHIQLGDSAAAQSELTTVLDLFESNREKITDAENRDRFFDAGQDTYDIAIDFAYKRNAVEQALAYAENSRARSLYQMIRAGARVIENHGEYEVHLGADSRSLTSAQIQELLPANTQLLEYSMLKDKVVIWVITRSSIKSEYRVIDAAEMEKQIGSFVEAISQPATTHPEAIVQYGKALYATLIAPVEGYLDSHLQLTIIPDKNLNCLPFEALVSPSSGRFLIEDYTVERAPSATIFVHASTHAIALGPLVNEKLLSVGNPRFDRTEFDSLPDLPAAAREAEQVAQLYRPEQTLLIGEAATLDQVQHDFAGADVIHLATHTVVNSRSPLLSKLLLATDAQAQSANSRHGILGANVIYETSLPRTRVVVLSACSTALERIYAGEGAISLARPFMVAGVPLVVASLWPVESNSAAELMISFHKHRKTDVPRVSTVQALRLAQLDLIHKAQTDSKPTFDWAGFVAIGGYTTF